MLQYRQATIEDIDQLIGLSICLIDESQYSGLWIDIEDIQETLHNFLTSPNAITYVAELDDLLIGFIVGTYSKLPFNKDLQASETLWYLHQEFRNTKIGWSLYELFLNWAKEKQVKVIHTASPNGSNLGKAYEKQGYTMFEEFYIKVLD